MKTILDNKTNKIHSVAVLVLCTIFLIFSIGIVLFGSHIYHSVLSVGNQNNTQRTALSFLANKVRSGDSANGLWLEQFGGSDTIVLCEDGGICQTRLYCYNGFLYELYCEPDAGLLPKDGNIILPLTALTAQWDGSLLDLTVQENDGSVYTLCLCHRCSCKEVAP